jgi:ATP adenylyltransferase
MHRMAFQPGTLWSAIVDRTAAAQRAGAIFPIPTTATFLKDRNVTFLVRVVANLERKHADRAGPAASPDFNPFLPYDDRMYVADISPSHVCLLNKFNVVEHHALIVTRAFESQDELLSLADFDALAKGMREFPSLGFYNAGTVAGASQRHKHLQIVPLPLAKQLAVPVPIEPALDRTVPDKPGSCPSLPWLHGFVRFGRSPIDDADDRAAERLLAAYRDLLHVLPRPASPYNLLCTREWMLLVPRSAEHASGMSINALGFAGALLVRNDAELHEVERTGPMSLLQRVSFPAR